MHSARDSKVELRSGIHGLTARRRALGLIAVVLIFVTGCSNAGISTTSGPQPAGSNPSKIALMVCQQKAVGEIDEAIGETAFVTHRSWVDHNYSCDYRFSSGNMILSVKELSSWAQTMSYFNTLSETLGKKTVLYDLGQGGFQAPDGSVVVRKDWKILDVNPVGLPSQFGSPPTTAGDVAATVAFVILGCWHGD